MRVRSRPAQGAKGAGPRGGLERPMRAPTAPLAFAVLALALAGCAGRLPAPVDSRVDEAPAKEAAAESSASAPGIAETLPEAPQPLDPLPSAAAVPADGDSASPSTPDAAEMPAEPVEIAPKRLAALNPAIMELLNDANRHSAEGRHDGAAVALERALQIEPQDAALWHRLARTRLDQGRLDLAEALAAKSNSLAAGDPNLQAQNWRVIAKARQKRGDALGAEDALARAARLAQ